MNTDDEKGLSTPYTSADWDPEDVQFAARADDGDVVMLLPEITYLDTQPWSVEIGLTPERLVQLRDTLDNHLRDTGGTANRGDTPTVATPGGGVANGSRSDIDTTGSDRVTPGHSAVGRQPTTVVQQTTVLSASATERTVAQQVTDDRGPSGTSVASQTEATETKTVTVPLRERLRAALRRHIDPDDDTMPALWRGGYIWVDADEVLDDLIKTLSGPDPVEALARVSAAVDTPSGPPGEPASEYGIGWDTAMELVRVAIEEQP